MSLPERFAAGWAEYAEILRSGGSAPEDREFARLVFNGGALALIRILSETETGRMDLALLGDLVHLGTDLAKDRS